MDTSSNPACGAAWVQFVLNDPNEACNVWLACQNRRKRPATTTDFSAADNMVDFLITNPPDSDDDYEMHAEGTGQTTDSDEAPGSPRFGNFCDKHLERLSYSDSRNHPWQRVSQRRRPSVSASASLPSTSSASSSWRAPSTPESDSPRSIQSSFSERVASLRESKIARVMK